MYMYLLQSKPLGTVIPKTRIAWLLNFRIIRLIFKKLRSNILFSHILIKIFALVGVTCLKDYSFKQPFINITEYRNSKVKTSYLVKTMNARYLQEFVFIYDDTWLFKNKFIKYFEGGQRTKIKVSFQAKKKKMRLNMKVFFAYAAKTLAVKKNP